jgi:hypothetical protein
MGCARRQGSIVSILECSYWWWWCFVLAVGVAAGGVAGKRVLHKVSRCINIESFKKSQRKRKKVLVLS